uniref:Zinc transporter ZIP8 n=1 Tax=Globodera pallida TaxID=36090 RepID=A0A183CIA1_GLOPA
MTNFEWFCDCLLQISATAKSSNKPDQATVWILGLTFVTVIGLCAVAGILVMRCLKKSLFNRFITFFVSVGVGSLSGSAVFHLLPHAFGFAHEPHVNGSHSSLTSLAPDYNYLWQCFAVIGGIYIFFFSDKFIKIVLETRKRSMKKSAELKQLHSNHKHEGTENGHLVSDALLNNDQHRVTVTQLSVNENTDISKEMKESERYIEQQTHALCVHDHEYKEGDSVIATVAWMIIFGDGLHNFIDGVTIGVGFNKSIVGGISVCVAVLCEEFPHELGDVAILVNSGMSMKQALVYNLLSAATCYVGFFVGVLVGEIDDITPYILGFAGGM